ncbi:MAG TPA: hypothetical protein VEZ90_15385 [Blastocatellia bacterium]|nr:hypothetical protein [Blastocatellia bacterium]
MTIKSRLLSPELDERWGLASPVRSGGAAEYPEEDEPHRAISKTSVREGRQEKTLPLQSQGGPIVKSAIPLIKHLRRVDELVFVNWETLEEQLVRRILRSSIGMVDEATNVPELKRSSQDGGSKRAGPINFSTFRDYRASQGTSQPQVYIPRISLDSPRTATSEPLIRTIAANVPDEEIVLSVVKREARRRAQRDLYILMLYHPGEHIMFSRLQIEGMLRAAGIDHALPTSQLVLRAVDLYRESRVPALGYSHGPQGILDPPALARVPTLTETERMHLLALEASLAVIDRTRAIELAQAGINPEDPLLERLQRLEEEGVALFIAQSFEGSDATPASAGDIATTPPAIESKSDANFDNSVPMESDPDLIEFPESVSRALFAAAADFAMSDDDPIKTLERNFDLLGALQSGIAPKSATRTRQLGFLYKALILETNRFLDVEDEDLRSAVRMLGGDVEDLFACKLRLLLTELRECHGTLDRSRFNPKPAE